MTSRLRRGVEHPQLPGGRGASPASLTSIPKSPVLSVSVCLARKRRSAGNLASIRLKPVSKPVTRTPKCCGMAKTRVGSTSVPLRRGRQRRFRRGAGKPLQRHSHPNKMKFGSGCTRECAKRRCKMSALSPPEKVAGTCSVQCGNGGMKPRHADPLAADPTATRRSAPSTALRCSTSAYRRQPTRTAPWLDQPRKAVSSSI